MLSPSSGSHSEHFRVVLDLQLLRVSLSHPLVYSAPQDCHGHREQQPECVLCRTPVNGLASILVRVVHLRGHCDIRELDAAGSE